MRPFETHHMSRDMLAPRSQETSTDAIANHACPGGHFLFCFSAEFKVKYGSGIMLRLVSETDYSFGSSNVCHTLLSTLAFLALLVFF